MIKYSFLAFLFVLSVIAYSDPAKAQEETELSAPRNLWNSDPVDFSDEEEDEEEENEDEEKKKKRRLNDSAGSPPVRKPIEEEELDLKPKREINVDMNFSNDALKIAQSCPQQWENEECLQATSQAALVLVSNFGGRLDQAGYKGHKEALKEDCAASTAATQEDGIPAYAMKSAYTVCMNKIADIADSTGVKPDPSYMQLLVATVLCMEKSPQCQMMEIALIKWGK